MRSLEPSSSVTVPPPDQVPAMPAKALDWAWLGDAAKPVKKNATAANVSRRVWANSLRCLAWLTDGTLPIDRYTRRQLMRHSISPIRSCH